MKGTIRWYNNQKGFGYIQNEDGEDIIVRSSDLDENITLYEGETVEYDIELKAEEKHIKNITKAP
jgi:cold shock protein